MTSVVNLNRFRKAKQRADKERRAAENRVAYGRSKAERRRPEAERRRDGRDLGSISGPPAQLRAMPRARR
jgi:hypothetical protein